MFVFARLGPGDKTDFEEHLEQQMKKHGVVLASGSNYHMSQPGWFRMSYALSPLVVKEGLIRIDKSLKALHPRAIMDNEAAQHVAGQGQKRKRVRRR